MDNVDMLLEPIRTSLRLVGAFLPRVLLAVLILLTGWLLAKAVRFALVKALRAVNFGVVAQKAGVEAFLRQGGGALDTIGVLGLLVYALVLLAALMIASNTLELAYVTELIGRLVLFVPRVIVAVLVLVFGTYFARFVGTALATYFHGAGTREAALIGRVAFYAIMVFVVLIAIEQLGLGDIIRQTFLILVAAVAFGLALAFGLGGRKRAAELIERWTHASPPPQQPPAPRKPVL